ncbi:MAG: lytic transglycosylase domain-containing protein [Nitrospira sp.]|nr:lytic transglycosylase domain-containing protein [Nitrospira sp.]MDH4235655.1 lytic transglycosylase domain-containing protein [Nitrospira sp.]MDH5252816.1 lytic transglycosylase domain-containing protein [Nitrospira sp.]MDH5625320.1 lytic transglycosylase domain-containing protein [Nitrospira sp.]
MPKLSKLFSRSTFPITMSLLFGSGLLTAVPIAQAEIYQYIDAKGTISLTNVPSDVRYRRTDILSNRMHQMISEQELEPMISRFSRQHQLHPALIRAVIKAESGFDPHAVSRAGAVGLMQLMPQTAVRMDVRDLYDPEDNIGGGTKYLRHLLDRFRGNLPLALAAYNAGEHAVDRYRTLPPFTETRQYVRKVLRYYRVFLTRDLAATDRGLAPSEAVVQPPAQSFSVFPVR